MVTVISEPRGLIRVIGASHNSLPYINYIEKGTTTLHHMLILLTFINTNILFRPALKAASASTLRESFGCMEVQSEEEVLQQRTSDEDGQRVACFLLPH